MSVAFWTAFGTVVKGIVVVATLACFLGWTVGVVLFASFARTQLTRRALREAVIVWCIEVGGWVGVAILLRTGVLNSGVGRVSAWSLMLKLWVTGTLGIVFAWHLRRVGWPLALAGYLRLVSGPEIAQRRFTRHVGSIEASRITRRVIVLLVILFVVFPVMSLVGSRFLPRFPAEWEPAPQGEFAPLAWFWPSVIAGQDREAADIVRAWGSDWREPEEGRVALIGASAFGLERTVTALLEAGSDPLARDPAGATALHYAAGLGRPRIAEILLRYEAAPNARDRQGRSPLHYAAGGAESVIAETLERYNARLPDAAEKGDKLVTYRAAAIEVLVRLGADVNAADSNARTPLAVAENAQIREVLLKHGATR